MRLYCEELNHTTELPTPIQQLPIIGGHPFARPKIEYCRGGSSLPLVVYVAEESLMSPRNKTGDRCTVARTSPFVAELVLMLSKYAEL